MSAFFRNTPQRAMDGNIANTPPNVPVPTEVDRPGWNQLQKEQLALAARAKTLRDGTAKPFNAWLKRHEPHKLDEPLDPVAQRTAIRLHKGNTTRSWRHSTAPGVARSARRREVD